MLFPYEIELRIIFLNVKENFCCQIIVSSWIATRKSFNSLLLNYNLFTPLYASSSLHFLVEIWNSSSILFFITTQYIICMESVTFELRVFILLTQFFHKLANLLKWPPKQYLLLKKFIIPHSYTFDSVSKHSSTHFLQMILTEVRKKGHTKFSKKGSKILKYYLEYYIEY